MEVRLSNTAIEAAQNSERQSEQNRERHEKEKKLYLLQNSS